MFLEVSVKEALYTTAAHKHLQNPVFKEACAFSVFAPLDILNIRAFTWTLLKEKRPVGEVTVPVQAISPGSSTLVLPITLSPDGERKETYRAIVEANLQ